MKYGSDAEAYGSLARNRRSLSASALGRELARGFFLILYFDFSEFLFFLRAAVNFTFLFGFVVAEQSERTRMYSGTGTSYISRASAAERPITDTYSRRYTYRSRSDMGSPRRYASQTLLDGTRPGPSTPHTRRDALHTLQRELDTLSRSPDRLTPRGYSSDTGYMNDTMRSRTRGYSNYDYGEHALPYHLSRNKLSRVSVPNRNFPSAFASFANRGMMG
ncbi:unnamed protein product [Gongylonema pulchrum]|uniref:Uncharacterized protein n=1 Tax=Gongylonema pulchrum TaxID=637853 RepID=A0A3P7RME6_9BILA|nr:unnamed protein product [Gongylonema pulchrum]